MVQNVHFSCVGDLCPGVGRSLCVGSVRLGLYRTQSYDCALNNWMGFVVICHCQACNKAKDTHSHIKPSRCGNKCILCATIICVKLRWCSFVVQICDIRAKWSAFMPYYLLRAYLHHHSITAVNLLSYFTTLFLGGICMRWMEIATCVRRMYTVFLCPNCKTQILGPMPRRPHRNVLIKPQHWALHSSLYRILTK